MKPRDMTLGPYNSTESIDRYKEVLTSIQLGHDRTVTKSKLDSSVNEVIVAFWKHAEQHYRRADGTTTSELVEYKYALQCLRKLAGSEMAATFGPMKLNDYVFSPKRAVEERIALRRAERATPLYASHQSRNTNTRKKKPKKVAGVRYSTHSYDRAIARAV